MASRLDSATFDPFKSSKYTLSLGPGLRERHAPNKQLFTSVRYNHKPQIQTAKSQISKPSVQANTYNLDLHSDSAETAPDYRYDGTRQSASSSYYITLDHENKTAQLECVDSDYAFNLVSAPEEKDAAKLAQQYPHISDSRSTAGAPAFKDPQSEEVGDVGNDLDGDKIPEADNPFDYRHYLEGLPGVGHATPLASPAVQPTVTAPLPAKSRVPSKPQSNIQKPSAKARKVLQGPTRRKAQRQTPRIEVDQDDFKQITREEALETREGIPSEAQSQDDGEDDGFVIEGEDDGGRQAASGSLSFLGTPTNAPISLRSAANSNSPNSQAVTPLWFEERGNHPSRLSDSESDDDVEDLRLGSPEFKPNTDHKAQATVRQDDNESMDEAADDNDDGEDFDAALAAIGDDEEEAAEPSRRATSPGADSEVSEEE